MLVVQFALVSERMSPGHERCKFKRGLPVRQRGLFGDEQCGIAGSQQTLRVEIYEQDVPATTELYCNEG